MEVKKHVQNTLATAKRWPRPLNRGGRWIEVSNTTVYWQINRDFGKRPLNLGWPFNRGRTVWRKMYSLPVCFFRILPWLSMMQQRTWTRLFRDHINTYNKVSRKPAKIERIYTKAWPLRVFDFKLRLPLPMPLDIGCILEIFYSSSSGLEVFLIHDERSKHWVKPWMKVIDAMQNNHSYYLHVYFISFQFEVSIYHHLLQLVHSYINRE